MLLIIKLFSTEKIYLKKRTSNPNNMDELYDAAVKLNNPPNHAGVVLRLARGAGTHWPWNGYIQNYGGSWLNTETKRPDWIVRRLLLELKCT